MKHFDESHEGRGGRRWGAILAGSLLLALTTSAFAGSPPAEPGRTAEALGGGPTEGGEGVPSTFSGGPGLAVVGSAAQVGQLLRGFDGFYLVAPLDPERPEGLVLARIFGDFELAIDRDFLARAELAFRFVPGALLAGSQARLLTPHRAFEFALAPALPLPLRALWGASAHDRMGLRLEAAEPGGSGVELGIRVRGRVMQLRQRLTY